MTKQSVSLFTVSKPDNNLITEIAAELVETSVDNGDGTWTYTVPILEGFKWSDDKPITANDWAFTYDTARYLGLYIGWTWGGEYYNGVTSVVADDDYTVSITFNYDPGLAGWQYGIGQAPAMPKHYWENFVTTKETLFEVSGIDAPVAGPWKYGTLELDAFYTWEYDSNTMWSGGKITRYSNGVSIKWENGKAPSIDSSFGDTTGKSFTYEKGPFVGIVEFSLYTDQDAAYLAYKNGEVNFVLNPLGLKRTTTDSLSRMPDSKMIINFQNGINYMSFNTRIFPGNNKAFRQAVACIMDKDFIIDNVLFGSALNMDGHMPAALTAWVAPVTGPLAECDGLNSKERWDKAIEHLKDGGWTATNWGSHPGGAERATPPKGLKGPNGEKLPSDMLLYAPTPAYDPLRSTFSLFIADWMQQLGFDVVARPTDISNIVDKVYDRFNVEKWHFYILGQGYGPYPDHHVYNFGSQNLVENGGFNSSGYNNTEYDELIGIFQVAKTVSEAQSISKNMEAILFEDLPWIPLFNTPVVEAYRTSEVQFPFTDVLDGLSGLDTTLLTSIVKRKS